MRERTFRLEIDGLGCCGYVWYPFMCWMQSTGNFANLMEIIGSHARAFLDLCKGDSLWIENSSLVHLAG